MIRSWVNLRCLSIRSWMGGECRFCHTDTCDNRPPSPLWTLSLLGHSHRSLRCSNKQCVSMLCLLAEPPPPHVGQRGPRSPMPPSAKLWARGQTLSCVPLLISCLTARGGVCFCRKSITSYSSPV